VSWRRDQRLPSTLPWLRYSRLYEIRCWLHVGDSSLGLGSRSQEREID